MTMKKYRCTLYGYIYDPANGDPKNEIAAGTPFKELSEASRSAGGVSLYAPYKIIWMKVNLPKPQTMLALSERR